ncbi:metallophosphoesterase [Sulfurovum sp.]|uniref:metallophosphoesterase family protein n=1 Tax=Sulfurovum sp. TaxID=1969726 RepID=UPI0025D939EB|nr:metallophosphoesterase [Sulfurovum sp.]
MAKISRRRFFKGAAAMTAIPFLAEAKETEGKERLKFIHITDSHMDLGNEESVEAMELVVEHINNHFKDLDFVVFGGDNFNNNVKGNEDALAYKKIVDKLHCPTYHVRGNKESHPNPDDAIHLEEFKTLFMSDRALKVNGKDWLLETKGVAFLGLDSCIEGANNGVYTEETLKFAESVLKSGKPTIILNHHPYTNYWKGTDPKDIHKYVLNNTEEVQKRLFGFDNLILTLSGHKHIDSVTTINKTKVVVTRGFIRPLDMDRYPMRYVEIADGKINEKLIYTM